MKRHISISFGKRIKENLFKYQFIFQKSISSIDVLPLPFYKRLIHNRVQKTPLIYFPLNNVSPILTERFLSIFKWEDIFQYHTKEGLSENLFEYQFIFQKEYIYLE